jgi:hypothetical protein
MEYQPGEKVLLFKDWIFKKETMMTEAIETRKQQIAFPVVANIRKGGPKGERRPGRDLEQKFRVVFEPGMEQYQKRFLELYRTLTPTTINAMLPFNDLSACYEISNEAYKAGMLVFKAVNGQVLVHRNPVNGDYLVRNGEAQVNGASTVYDPYEFRAITYTGHNGGLVTLPIKTQTRVKLFIPEMEDFVWFLLKSNSYYDSLNIENNIAAVQMVANAATGGRVAGVRINVFRAQQSILWNSDNGPRRIQKWLLNIKIDPSWVKEMAVRMSEATLGAGTQVQAQLTAPESAPDPELDQDTSDNEPEDGVIDGEAREVGDVSDEVEPMTIERAYSMENSEGLKYGEISEDGLASMRTRLEDLLLKLDGTEEDVTLYYNYQEKLAAIKVLQQAHEDGSI